MYKKIISEYKTEKEIFNGHKYMPFHTFTSYSYFLFKIKIRKLLEYKYKIIIFGLLKRIEKYIRILFYFVNLYIFYKFTINFFVAHILMASQ